MTMRLNHPRKVGGAFKMNFSQPACSPAYEHADSVDDQCLHNMLLCASYQGAS